jgi:hypothetical protein
MSENPPAGRAGKTGKPASRTGRYLKYAIGEIVLVVIGILIALSINNWNEDRKLLNQREAIINSLIDDFEYNTSELTNNTLILYKKQLSDMDKYFSLINYDTRYYSYNPNMTAYNEAKSSSYLSLLDNKLLLRELTQFIRKYEDFIKFIDEVRYTFHNGSTWEIRKTLSPGTIYNSNFSGSTAKDIPYSEYLSIMRTPLAQNALQNAYMLIGNCDNHLNQLEFHSKNILKMLKEMQLK